MPQGSSNPTTSHGTSQGTCLRAAAADAVHQPLWLQIGVPALARAVLLAIEVAEHIGP